MGLKRLFQCFWFILGPGIGLTMTPSSTQTSSFTSSSTTSSINVTVSTPSPLSQHNMCRTGPQFDNLPDVADNINAYRLAVTDHIYLDNSEPLPCSGVITGWHYCYVVLGFHNVSSGLQPCVWRRSNSNDSNAGYKKVGCNEFTIIPGERDGLQCQYFTPLSHSDFIRVEEGDYIGFYVPDAGLFLPFSSPDDDTDSYQQQRTAMGFAPFIKDSELRNATTQPGRVLLRAEIDAAYIFPSATVSSSALLPTPVLGSTTSSIVQIVKSPRVQPVPTAAESTTSTEPVTTTAPVGTISTVLLVVGVVAPSVIAFIVVLVTTSIVCVYCKKYMKYKRFHSDTAKNPAYSMVSQNHVMIGNQLTLIDCTNNQAYNHGMFGKLETVVQVKNQAYNVLSAKHVIIGKQRTTVDLHENPAYDLTTPMGQPKSKTQRPDSIASSAGKRQLEHTYESLSPYYSHPYHRLS